MLSLPDTHLGIHTAPQMSPGKKKTGTTALNDKCSKKCLEQKQQTKHRAQKGEKKGTEPYPKQETMSRELKKSTVRLFPDKSPSQH